MAYTPPIYPGAIPTIEELFGFLDDIDWNTVDSWDALRKELNAVLAELGTDPAGGAADVKTRLAVSLDTNGALKTTLTPTFAGLTISGNQEITGQLAVGDSAFTNWALSITGDFGTDDGRSLTGNCYYDGGFKYVENGNAYRIRFYSNAAASEAGMTIYTAPYNSGGAGAALTFTERFKITASGWVEVLGNLSVGTYFRRLPEAGITASTNQAQGQGPLTKDINQISVCANEDDAVTLPTAVAGKCIKIINTGVQRLQVWPASGGYINEVQNTSVTIQSYASTTFACYATGYWWQMPHGAV